MNKKTDKQLRQLEDKYGELSSSRENLLVTLNSIGDAVIATDINGYVNYLNLVAEKLTGWTLEDALNRPLADVFHIVNAQTKEPAFNPVKQVLKNAQVVGLANHTQLIARDGTEYHIADSAAPIKDSNGHVIGVVLVFRDVSDEYAVRMALEESENRYRNLFENAEISIWNEDFSKVYQALDQLRLEGVTDLRLYLKNNPQAAWDMAAMLRVLHVNQATLKLFGASSDDEFIPQIDKTFGDGAIDVFIGGLCAYWENKRVFRAEANFHRLDGRDINAIISYQIPETAEAYKNIAVSILDITERKQMEQALQDSEEKYRALYENAPLAYQSLDEQGNFIEINPAWLTTLGYDMDEVIGKNFADFLHPDWKAHFVEIFPKFKRAGCVHGVYCKIRHKNGHYLDIEFEGCVGYNPEGNFKQTYCVFQDVTKRKQAEEALRESEVHMRTLVETLPDLIWLKNPEGVYLNCNPKFERLFGAKQHEIVGKTDYDFVDKELADFFREKDRAVMAEGSSRANEEEVSYADDGHSEYLETIKTPMFDGDGKLIGVLGVGRDITERKQTEQALRRSQKMDAVGQLTGGIAHDFNNIINIILGNLELLTRQIPDDEAAQSRVINIHKSAQRAADLTRQLLSFSRRQAEQIEKTDISFIIHEMDSLIRRSVTPQVEVEHLNATDLWQTEIDPGDFEDSLLNLVLNARDAMHGQGSLVIETRNRTLDADYCARNSAARPGDYVELSISDSGKGIAAEQLEHIFEPFYTTKEQGKGTGLGLSMVYGFIQRSNGHIKVDSEENAGTTFRLYMPRSKQVSSVSTSHMQQSETPSGGNETILVVDDEEALRELVEESLQELGYRVLTAGSGKQALKILSQNSEIDLLMSDVIMPGGLNGYELAEQATISHPQIKVVLASGYSESALANSNRKNFSAILLNKPYSLKELAQQVKTVLETG